MKRWICLLLLLTVSLSAASRQRDGCWEPYGGGTYWNICADSFVVTRSESEIQLLSPSNEAGYVAGLAYRSCDGKAMASASYTELTATFTQTYDGLLARRKFKYEAIDARMGGALSKQGCDVVYGFCGGRYLEVWQEQETPDLYQKMEFKGGAVQLGASASLPVQGGFAATVEMVMLFGLGEQTNVLVEEEQRVRVPAETVCVPALEGRIGARYIVPCQSYILVAESGYEAIYYYGILRSATSLTRLNVGFHGPYARLALRF